MNTKDLKPIASSACAIGLLFSLAACEVNQTKETKLPSVGVEVTESGQIPKYDVVKTQEGKMPNIDVTAKKGQMPEFEVDVADIEVGTTKKKLTVPDVDIKKKEVEVTLPDVDIEMPGEEADAASGT